MQEARPKAEKEKHALAKWFLGTVAQPLQNSLPRLNFMAQLAGGFQTQAHKGVAPIQIIHGMGGVGKTQLAANYVNQHTQHKDFVCWIYADKIRLEDQWLAFGEKLLGRELKGIPKAGQLAVIQAALSQKKNWLIVLDNLENKAALDLLLLNRLLPTQQILITTRSQHWGNYLVLLLPPFTPEESQAYIEARLKPEQCADADKLAQALGHMPLPLAHVVAYMKQTDKTASAYLKLYEEKGIALLAKENIRDKADAPRYNATVLITYQISIEELAKKHPKAAELVIHCAYFHSEGIKKSFLKGLLDLDEKALDDCIHHVRDYGFLSKGNKGRNMHRLLQQVIRYQQTPQERQAQLTGVTQCLTTLNPGEGGDAAAQRRWSAFMPHLEAVIGHHDQSAFVEDTHLAIALVQLGNLHYALGHPGKSCDLYTRVLAIKEAHYGRDHAKIVITLRDLSVAHGDLGDVAKARDCLERALAIDERHHGRDHIQVAVVLADLGNAYGVLGDVAKARDCLERALVIQEAHYGLWDHTQVAITLTNLGNAYGALGNITQQRDSLERALAILEAYYGRDHYQVAPTLMSLGNVYGDLEDFAKKQELLECALAIQEAHYGPEHYQLAATLMNLGNAYGDLGDVAKKRDFLERALSIEGAHYGRDHPELAITLTNLVVAYHELKQPKAALQAAQSAYRILMNNPLYGAAHPTTKQCLTVLQSTCQFTLKDLQRRPPVSQAAALNAYSGTLLNQERQQARAARAVEKAEEKVAADNESKQDCVVL